MKELLKAFPKTFSEELGIDLTKPSGRFKWFLAAILFGARISETIVKNTYREFEKAGVTSADKIIETGWDGLVKILDEGGYVRYDFKTASMLLDVMKKLKKYGSLETLYENAKDYKDLERRLQEFKGVGPVTVNIFLRELRPIWKKANPELSPIVKLAANNLGVKLKPEGTKRFVHLEAALLRLGKNFCKKKGCKDCPVRRFCRSNKITT